MVEGLGFGVLLLGVEASVWKCRSRVFGRVGFWQVSD